MKYLNDYKSKHFVLADEDDEMFGSVGTIEDDDITDTFLKDHIEACMYYGIPSYTGSDGVLRERIEAMEKVLFLE